MGKKFDTKSEIDFHHFWNVGVKTGLTKKPRGNFEMKNDANDCVFQQRKGRKKLGKFGILYRRRKKMNLTVNDSFRRMLPFRSHFNTLVTSNVLRLNTLEIRDIFQLYSLNKPLHLKLRPSSSSDDLFC